MLHPSRVVRFLGNPYPDPLLYGAQLWSDSVLQALYDAVHGAALATAGATSLLHEAKVDVVTVPGLSEHLANAATTAQLSSRFAYAAARPVAGGSVVDGRQRHAQHLRHDRGAAGA